MIRLIIIGVVLFIIGHLVLAGTQMPVYRWGDIEYGDNGSVTMYECSSPSYWDKWTNSPEWQEFEAYWEGK